MLSKVLRWLVAAGSAWPAAVPAAAQPPAAEVAVSAVRIAVLREAGGWCEAEIELAVKPPPGAGRFVNRVRVSLGLAVEPAGPPGRFDFYRAEMEAVALAEGRASLRFYLPPEIVERDRLEREKVHYAVEIAADSRPQPPSRAARSARLDTPVAAASFASRLAAEAPRNDGILLPQYLTPWAHDPRRPAPTPVRKP